MTDRLSVEDCFYVVRWNWSGALTNATQHLHSFEPWRELCFELVLKLSTFAWTCKQRGDWNGLGILVCPGYSRGTPDGLVPEGVSRPSACVPLAQVSRIHLS